MDDSNKRKRGEAREFWEAAIRLWTDSGLSVREFCHREGLAPYTFYSWRREFLPANTPRSKANQTSFATTDVTLTAASQPRWKRKQVAADEMPVISDAVPFIELAAPMPAALCRCTLELENRGGAKMRIQLHGNAMPDLVAISQTFWNGLP